MNGTAAARRAVRYVSAALLFGIGALHLQQYFVVYYRVIPVIGDLFVANFAIAVVLGLALLAPIERIPRFGPPLFVLVALAGIGFAVGVIIGVETSEYATLFGFHENGYRTAITVSLVLEGAAIVALSVLSALHLPGPPPARLHGGSRPEQS